MPNFVDDFFGKDFSDLFENQVGTNTPAINIVESKDDFKIEVAAPGLEKGDFKINLDNKLLTISSEKEQNNEHKDGNFVRREFNFSSFKRSFSLPDSIDSSKISANHKDGILYVSVPKREEAKEKTKREIEVG